MSMMKIDSQRLMGTEEAIAKTIDEMMDVRKEKIKMLSDLDIEEISVLSMLSTLSKTLKINSLEQFIDDFCRFRISKARMGRKEFTSMITMAGFNMEQNNRSRSIRSLFSGIRG